METEFEHPRQSGAGPEGALPTVELSGVELPLDPAVIGPRVENALRVGKYESAERSATPRFLTPEDRVIELGAGIGFISTYIATALGVASVLCVEANRALIPYIRRLHARHGLRNTEVRCGVAISDAADDPPGGVVPFHIADPFWSSSLIRVRNTVKRVDAPVMRLSDLVKEVSATALVVDIEGGERDLFERVDFGGVEKIFVELHKRYIRSGGVKKVFDDLSAQNFVYDQAVSSGGMVLFRKLTG